MKPPPRHYQKSTTLCRHLPDAAEELPNYQDITETPHHGDTAELHKHTTETPQKHHQDTIDTQLRHQRKQGTTDTICNRDTTEAPPRHHQDTTEAPPRHHQDTTETSPRHHWDTETPLGLTPPRPAAGNLTAPPPWELTNPSYRYSGIKVNDS